MRHFKAAGALSASLALIASALFAAPATAAPVDGGTYHDGVSEPIEDLCGVAGHHDGDYRGHFVATRKGADGLVHYTDAFRTTEVWTNLETGRSFTEVIVGVMRDAEVTDNGDGTLTIRVLAAGGYRSYDGDGKLFLRDPGMIQWEILVDDGGTPGDPFDDEFLTFLGVVRDSTGLNELDGRDFCEDFHIATD